MLVRSRFGSQVRNWGLQYPSGQHIWYNYGATGRLTGFCGRNWGFTSYGYNDRNQLTTVTDPHWTTMTNTYDAVGRVASQTDRAGGTTTFDYATDGTTTIVSPGGRTTAETLHQRPTCPEDSGNRHALRGHLDLCL